MNEIDFAAGSEKRFFDFISGLNEKSKIAIISHLDLDGIAAAKIANEVLNADIIKFIDYTELNDALVDEMTKKKVTKFVFTDICGQNFEIAKKFSKFADVLVIDHHPIIEDFNSDKCVFLCAQGYCAAYMCYNLFSRVQDLSRWDWLAAAASISDFCFERNGSWMGEIFKKYGKENINCVSHELSLALIYFGEELRKVFEMIESNYLLRRNLKKYANDVQKEMDFQKEKFYKERAIFGDVYYWKLNKSKYSIKSYIISGLSCEEKNKTFIFAREDGQYIKLSARRQDNRVDVAALLMKLVAGLDEAAAGGHFAAGGGHILAKDEKEFVRRLQGLKQS